MMEEPTTLRVPDPGVRALLPRVPAGSRGWTSRLRWPAPRPSWG